jgi:hypothetical protein
MNEQAETGTTPASGREARRRFLKNSSGAAVAIPAAVLLLSASRANAQPVGGYTDTTLPPPR